jgi:unsaturated rhamnogalacturonyl hydrolase
MYCQRQEICVTRLIVMLIATALFSVSGVAPLAAAERWSIGLTANDAPIEALMVPGPSDSVPTVLLIGGLQGPDASVDVVRKEVDLFETRDAIRRPFRLLAIPLANPDGKPLQFPPTGTAYRENTESHVLWRWIGIHAPDLVLIAANGEAPLADALSQNVVALVGKIPSRTVSPQAGILQALRMPIAPSEAHRELDRRRSRTPRVVAEELARVYGHDFNQPTYILAMALIAQLRLGNTAEVMRVAEPYLNGSRNPFAMPSQSSLAAHMLFTEIARRTGDTRAAPLVRRAANSGFMEDGTLREFMPLNGGWSDSVFMDIPILAQAGALSHDRKYFDMAARHLAYMQMIIRRPDGLYRHQASTDAAWGRGNGFPALGLALTLSDFPTDHPAYQGLLAEFQRHMKALAPLQDENGMFREVVDVPGAYPEYSGTAMIATAMLRGVRKGWLDAATYQPIVDRAWRAIALRTASDGTLVDVAESTGTKGFTQKDYFRRAAILGADPRGGAFAMLFATEVAGIGVEK